MTELAMRMGGHAQVGLEDNIYMSKGVLAEGSAPLVARAAAYARSIGRTRVEPRGRARCSGCEIPACIRDRPEWAEPAAPLSARVERDPPSQPCEHVHVSGECLARATRAGLWAMPSSLKLAKRP